MMKVELIGLSQGISFENKQATNYLDFRKDSGEMFRLEVPQSVAEALLAIMLKEEPTPTREEVIQEPAYEETEDLGEATTFGGDEPPEIPMDDEPVVERPMSHIGPSVESEEDVPSV
jgi:hypothetical protein